jgi:hypothetical protein
MEGGEGDDMNSIGPRVDMSSGNKGYVELRNGQKLWCVIIYKDGELYKVRTDMAHYLDVDINGRIHPTEEHKHDVVKFNPDMKWLQAVKEFIPTEITLC